jgi:Na+-translocating ferredoxin:NAD+ oxidoreductase RnfG subunit
MTDQRYELPLVHLKVDVVQRAETPGLGGKFDGDALKREIATLFHETALPFSLRGR